MFEVGKKNKVFSQYNTAIIVLFIFIVFSAMLFATYRFSVDLDQYKKIEIESLSQQVKQLDHALSANVDAITSIQKLADYHLKYPDELPTKTPHLIQDEESFYVERTNYNVIEHKQYVRNNITGIGDITKLDDEVKTEISMSNMLTPAFVAAKQANDAVIWYYYASLNQFVSIYPSINRNSWQYSSALINREPAQKIINQNNNKSVVWSAPYIDSSGEGLNTSLGLGVVNKDKVTGILYADISLSEIQKYFKPLEESTSHIVLMNNDQDILINASSNTTSYSLIEKWLNVTPNELSEIAIEKLGHIQIVNDLLVQKYVLPTNGWIVIKYQSYTDFYKPILSYIILSFLTFFIGLLLFMAFVYWLTYRTFIEPTRRFISHIEYSAEGDPGKIKPSNDWLHWFKVVENIFGQNRSLLQRLTEHNSLLDTRVNEKTKALQDKIVQHKRDYAHLRSVMNAIPEFILFNDTEGRIVGFNNAFGHFIQKEEKEVLGKKANEILFNELGQTLTDLTNSDNTENGIQRVIKTAKSTYDVFCTNIYSDTGKEAGTIDIIRDVSVQYEVQKVLEKTKNQAEFANKAKSQFLANMSHEIRTPINAMQGMITLLGRSSLTNNQRQHIDNAYGASKSLLYLVDQLLDLAKIESGEMTIVKGLTSVDSIVDKAIKLNIGLANYKKLNIEVDIASDIPPFVETDEMRLIQVLTNLLHNAVKFTHEGEIKLGIQLLNINANHVDVRFTIKDTGIGIAKHKQANLFEAFKQADDSMTREYGGSGLGLSICQEIVNLLDGKISLESELDRGCEFTVDLPFYLKQPISETKVESQPLVLCSYGLYLPESIIASMHWLGWEYKEISQLSDVALLPKSTDIVLLISEGSLSELLDSSLQQYIEMLCICQPQAYGMNVQELELLERLTVPYILQEHPLYRQMLCYINKSLYRSKQSKKEAIEIKNNDLEGVSVLVVEDNLVNQLVARELLVNMKAEVTIVENGQLAIDILEKQTFDVVLMDIQMPVMDGLTATKLIRENPKYIDLPIIAMTAHARTEDREKSLEAGMNLHMAKPVKYETLLTSIQDLLV